MATCWGMTTSRIKGPMELGRLLSRLPASTVRLRLRVTLTFVVFLVGSHQGALGITQRARQPWPVPFDDRITVMWVTPGWFYAVRTAQGRAETLGTHTGNELARRATRWPCVSGAWKTVHWLSQQDRVTSLENTKPWHVDHHHQRETTQDQRTGGIDDFSRRASSGRHAH